MAQIMKHRRAWRGHWPRQEDVARLLTKYPHTTFLAITRRGADYLNQSGAQHGRFARGDLRLAVAACFAGHRPAIVLDGDLEANPENYDENGQLKPPTGLVPLRVECYPGMKIFTTKNVDKERDYVNGMECVVEEYDSRCHVLLAETVTGHRLAIRPWTDVRLGNRVYNPIKPGYANTVLKMAGSELPHVVFWLDAEHVPGAAYTGMSRVRRGADLLLGGNVNPSHFTPVSA